MLHSESHWCLELDNSFRGCEKWDQQNLAHLLSHNKAHGSKSPEMAASNLAQMLQDVRNHKRNCKTGSRTPGWLQEIIVHLKLKPETSEDRRPSTSKATSKASGCKLTIGDSWSTCSPKAKPHSAGLQKKRTLKLSLSTNSLRGVAMHPPLR